MRTPDSDLSHRRHRHRSGQVRPFSSWCAYGKRRSLCDGSRLVKSEDLSAVEVLPPKGVTPSTDGKLPSSAETTPDPDLRKGLLHPRCIRRYAILLEGQLYSENVEFPRPKILPAGDTPPTVPREIQTTVPADIEDYSRNQPRNPKPPETQDPRKVTNTSLSILARKSAETSRTQARLISVYKIVQTRGPSQSPRIRR